MCERPAGSARARAVLELRPHAELTRLPGLGHCSQLEDPSKVRAVIERHASAS